MTTMDKPLEQILKEEILGEVVEEASAVKVYGKIAGLKCIGRSYFYDKNEVVEKYQWAQQQMTGKYGDEMYGKSAQLGGQSANKSDTKNDSGTGTGTSSGNPNSLINCTVSPLMKLPTKFLKEASGDFNKFWKPFQKFIDQLNQALMDKEWKLRDDADKIVELSKKFNRGSGPTSKDNVDTFQEIVKILNNREWKSFMQYEMKELGEYWKQAAAGWQEWTGKSSSDKSGGDTRQMSSGELKQGEWNPYQACRIDIHTSFDQNWYKRKFKSGLLNKLIFAIKTDARSHGTEDMNKSDPMANHRYTADEMLPQDTRKLDSIQWKMTNKVARDFITYFMGWTRNKTRKPDSKDGKPGAPVEELAYDESFGGKMADAALSNRGILGRLRQKIFSGGQSNNVISVAFQMADPNDGWKVVDEDVDGDEGNEGDEVNGETGEDGKDSGSDKGTPSPDGKTDEKPGSGESDTPEISDDEIKKILTILQRVMRLEKEVFGKTMEESSERRVDDVVLGYLEN